MEKTQSTQAQTSRNIVHKRHISSCDCDYLPFAIRIDHRNPEATKVIPMAPPTALALGAFSNAWIHLGKLCVILICK